MFKTDFGNCEACKEVSRLLDELDGKPHRMKKAWLILKERFAL